MLFLIIRYGEIALKGKNRVSFERKLISHINQKLKRYHFQSSHVRHYGRITFEVQEKKEFDNNQNIEQLNEILKRIPGVFSFSIGKKYNYKDINDVKKQVLSEIKSNNKFKESNSFKVECKRVNKKLMFKSTDIEQKVGAELFELFDKKVDLKNPDFTVRLEFLDDYYVFFLNIKYGMGGLPLNSEGRGLSLLSGGFDSPIASVLALKRGINLDYVHFMSVINDKQKALDKVKEIMQELSRFQIKTRIFLVPFLEVQNYIASNFPPNYRLIFLRRAFLKFANELAKKENYQTIVTGDNIGQVSSQTLVNMDLINRISEKMVLRPLICYDKLEIMNLARKYGTYDISSKKADDLCSMFNPTNPITRAKEEYLEFEDEIFFNLINETLVKTQIIEYN